MPLATNHPTLAELLATQNYRTAAFIGSVILDSKRLAPGFDRGFEFFDHFPEHAATKTRWGRLERRGMEVEQRAESWLSRNPGGSHFVWLHFYDPHDPYEPPPPYSEVYKERLYDGEIAYADSALGRFLAYLKRQGWFEKALIVVVGDHGEGLGEHHEDTHGIFLYDSTTHVPLLVKVPGNRKAGTQVQAQVRTIDLAPTILDLLGFPSPGKLDGASLSPLLDGAVDANSRTVFGQTDYPLQFGWAPLRSIRKENLKFIEAPQPELYDLRADPKELNNKYEPWNGDVQSFRQSLAELNAKSAAAPSNSAAAVPQQTIDELHALGYLGRADAHSSTNVPEPAMLPDPKDKIEQHNLLHVAMLAAENGELPKARDALERVLQLEKDSVIALTQLGQIELKSGNKEAALTNFRKAHELRPDDTTVLLEYAKAQEATGDLAGAGAVLQATLKSNPNQFALQLLLGNIEFRMGETNAALDHLEDAVLQRPDNTEAKIDLSRVLLREKKFAEVADLLEPIAAKEKDPNIYEVLVEAYRGLGRTADAKRAELRYQSLRRAKE